MHVIDPQVVAAKPGDPAWFTGAVSLRPLAATPPPSNFKLFRVEFAPGARTAWHTHSGLQLLVVVAGRCRFQHAGGPVQEAVSGELISIPAGEKHWHGATPDAAMVHLALNVDLETEWLEPVTDEQYRGTA